MIVLAALAFIVLRFATRWIGKLIGFLVLIVLAIGAMYFSGLGPFQKTATSPYRLMDRYCSPNHPEPAYCECIVKPVVTDLMSRFTEGELEDLRKNRWESAYAFKKSLEAQKATVDLCLNERNKDDLLKKFLLDLSGVPDEIINELGDLQDSIHSKANKSLDEIKSGKKEINKRY